MTSVCLTALLKGFFSRMALMVDSDENQIQCFLSSGIFTTRPLHRLLARTLGLKTFKLWNRFLWLRLYVYAMVRWEWYMIHFALPQFMWLFLCKFIEKNSEWLSYWLTAWRAVIGCHCSKCFLASMGSCDWVLQKFLLVWGAVIGCCLSVCLYGELWLGVA